MKKIKILKVWDLPEEGEVGISSIKVEYHQKADCCSNQDLEQHLTIETQNGGIEAKDTFYSMTTERWSFDSPNELLNVVTDFINKCKQPMFKDTPQWHRQSRRTRK